MKRILLLAGLLLIVATVRMTYISALSNNTVYLAGITCCIWGYWLFYEKLINKTWLNVLMGTTGFLFLMLVGFIAANGLKGTATYREDAVIVLGAGIKDGELRKTLRMRLDKTVEYHKKNPDALIIVSGGQGRGEVVTEASVMARYLAENGVPEEIIFQEGEAVSTYTNIRYAKPILNGLFPDEEPTVAIITSNFHIYRSVKFARQAGIRATHLPAPTPWYNLPANYVREAAAVVKLWVIRR